jgi:hypothetical protein
MLIRGADIKVWGAGPRFKRATPCAPGAGRPVDRACLSFCVKRASPAPSVAGLSFCISWRAQKRATALHAGCESGALGRTGSLVKGGNLSIVLEA